MKLKARRSTAVSLCLLLSILLLACGTAGGPDQACLQAIKGLPSAGIEGGLFELMTSDIAATLPLCKTAAEWKSALQLRPDVVNMKNLTVEEADHYFRLACEMYERKFEVTEICRQ